MTKIKTVIEYLESIAPLELQADYDNAGLIVGNPDQEISNVLVTLDSIEQTVDEAISRDCNLIVAHHPIIFTGLKKITGRDYIQRTIIKAIKHDIAIYAIHTNLDSVHANGVNKKISDKIGLQNTRILAPSIDENTGSGMIGELTSEMSFEKFIAHLKEAMSLNLVKSTKNLGKPIKKVAVCGGSGSFLTQAAIDQNADVFISSDYKYHQFFDANDQIIIMDIGHYESEYFTIELLTELLTEKFSTFASHFTGLNTNPVKFY